MPCKLQFGGVAMLKLVLKRHILLSSACILSLLLLLQFNPVTVKASGTADLVLKQIVNTSSFTVGSQLTYTILVVNNGPDTATGLRVRDTMQSEVTLVSDTTAQGYCGPSSTGFSCNLNNLPAGGMATITLVVQGNTAGLVVNSALVTGNETDVDMNSNSAYQATTLTASSDSNPVFSLGAPVVVLNEGQSGQASGTLNIPRQTGATLTASLGTIDSSLQGPGGTWRWSYTAPFDGPRDQTVSLVATDPSGLQARISFEVVVNSVNRAPNAVYDLAATRAGKAVFVNVLANDSDPDNDPISLTGVTGQPANGVAQIYPDQTILYGPNPGFSGVDSFIYSISDGHGGTSQTTVTVNVVAGDLNENPPSTGDDVFGMFKNTTTSLADAQLMANDTDIDGDSLTISSVSASSPAGASFVLNGDDSITVTPPSGFTGTMSGTYTVNDGRGGTATGNITVYVLSPVANEQAPIVTNDTFTSHQGQSFSFKLTDLLNNDMDPNGDPMTVVSIWLDSYHNGWLHISQNGTVTYTPPNGFTGTVTGSYKVSDGTGLSTIGQFTISVTS